MQLALEHLHKIEQSVSQHMLPLPPSIHNDPSNWEYPFIPPITPVASQHMPTQVLQQELPPTTPFSQPELPPTTPVASQHITTPLSQQQLSPPVPTTPVAPQHVLSPSTLIAQHPQSHQFMHPLQPEVPAPELSASVPSHDLHFTPSFLASIRVRSCSRQNFAVNLVQSLISLDEIAMLQVYLGKRSLTLKGFHVLRRQRFRRTH